MDTRHPWTKSLTWLLPILLTVGLFISVPSSVSAQGWGEYIPPPGVFSTMSNFDFGRVNLRTLTAAGYQLMGLNFNLTPSQALADSTVDLHLRRSEMWVGSVGVELQFRRAPAWNDDFAPFISLFLKATANVPKSVRAVTTEDPLPPFFVTTSEGSFQGGPPDEWPSSRLEWWLIDGGALYQFSRTLALMAGLRRDHLTLRFDQSLWANFPLGTAIAANYGGDFLEKLWVPYLGVQISERNYRASFIWSPFVSASLHVPLRSGVMLSVPDEIFSQTLRDFRFSVFNPGALLEVNFEYNQNFTSGISFGVWGTASWLKIRDNGQLTEQFKQLVIQTPFIPIFQSSTESDSGAATLTRSIIAGGIMAEVKF